jgi:hypothetical protein
MARPERGSSSSRVQPAWRKAFVLFGIDLGKMPKSGVCNMLILNGRHLRVLGKCPKSAVTCAFLSSLRPRSRKAAALSLGRPQ